MSGMAAGVEEKENIRILERRDSILGECIWVGPRQRKL